MIFNRILSFVYGTIHNPDSLSRISAISCRDRITSNTQNDMNISFFPMRNKPNKSINPHASVVSFTEGILRYQIADGWISGKLRGGNEDSVISILRELVPPGRTLQYEIIREGKTFFSSFIVLLFRCVVVLFY